MRSTDNLSEMPEVVYALQQQRIDTAANWASNNPILLEGEIGIESDTRKFKFGNGTSAWNSLSYASSVSTSTLSYVTGSLAAGASEDFTLSGASLFQLLSYTASTSSWVRVYGTSAARSADTRTSPGGTVPVAGTEYYSELVTTTAAQTIRLSPVPLVQATAGNVFVRVKNMDSVTRTLALSFTILSLSA